MDAFGFSRVACDEPAPGVARLRIDNPESHNALDSGTCAELVGGLRFAAETPSVRVVVIAARGDTFCAGGELPSEIDPESGRTVAPLLELRRALFALGKPSIALVQGGAHGSGLALVLACDFALAGARATFCAPEIRYGLWSFHLVPDLVRTVGRRRAAELLACATPLDAREAQRLGLVQRVVPDGALGADGLRLAAELASRNPRALARGLAALRAAEEQNALQVAMQVELDELMASDEARLAVERFADGEPPIDPIGGVDQ